MAETAGDQGGPGGATYCGQCGAGTSGTRFCTACGAAVASPGSPTDVATASVLQAPVQPAVVIPPAPTFPPQQASGSLVVDPNATMPQGAQAYPQDQTVSGMTPPPVYPAQPVASSGRRSLWIGGGVLAALVIIGAVAGFLILGKNSNATAQGPTYSAEVVSYLRPVISDNAKLAYGVATLTPAGTPSASEAATTTAEADVQAAQQSISSLKIPAGDQTLATEVNAALASESEWLKTVSTVLGDPSNPLASQLAGLGEDMSTKFEALGTTLPKVANATMPNSTKIVAYAAGVTANAAAIQATTQFDNQVSSLLDQSSSSFQQVNDFYGQLNNVVNGGSTDLTIAQAEQEISSIIANRNSLQAAAQALNAPTPGAQAVAADLVAAFAASLQDDNDLSSCLNEQNYGTVAYIYGSCLSSTASDNSAATTAKQTFVSAYNQLRATVGQPPVSPSF